MLVRMGVLGLLCKGKIVAESLCHRGTTGFELHWSIDSLVWHRTPWVPFVGVLWDCHLMMS